MILKREIEFEFDPVLLWMMGNVVAKLDKKDNIFPDKERRESKIDGVIALIMALRLAMAGGEVSSVYEERGILML